MDKILITGALGQLGTELVSALASRYGESSVLATDLHEKPQNGLPVQYQSLDVMDSNAVLETLRTNKVTQVYHLAAILSAKGESNPTLAWDVNMNGLLTILEAGKELKLEKVYWPSSIAVFGDDTPKNNTPQYTVTNPSTVYGIGKLAGERWCAYYYKQFNLDVRSLRYPGLIGYKAPGGGGTTDYAVDIYQAAVQGKAFNCFLKAETMLPMMYMNDAVKATIDLMEADSSRIHIRSSYNLAGMSFSPAEVHAEILKYYPDFKISYNPDFRQSIAESWPNSIDDSVARNDWGWAPDFNLKKMTEDIIHNLSHS